MLQCCINHFYSWLKSSIYPSLSLLSKIYNKKVITCFRLAIQAVHQSGFFEGPEENKIFSHDLGLLEKKHYRLVGRLVALSLTQEGPGLNSLNKQLFNLMVGQDVDLSDVQLTMIPEELKELIRQVIIMLPHFSMKSFRYSDYNQNVKICLLCFLVYAFILMIFFLVD